MRKSSWIQRSLPGHRGTLSNRRLAIASMIAATFLWGSSYVAAKAVLDDIPPFTLALLRMVIAIAVLLPVLVRSGIRPEISRQTVILGATGIAGMNALHNLGIGRTSASNACLILIGGVVIMTPFLGALVLNEMIRLNTVASIAVAGIGIAMVAAPADFRLLGGGELLLLAAGACVAIYTVVGRTAFKGNLLAVTTGATIVGAVLLVPGTVYEGSRAFRFTLSIGDILILFFLGAAITAGTALLWGFSLRYLEAGESAILSSLEPAVGVALAMLLLGEPLRIPQLLGTSCIALSCFLGVRRSDARLIETAASSSSRTQLSAPT